MRRQGASYALVEVVPTNNLTTASYVCSKCRARQVWAMPRWTRACPKCCACGGNTKRSK